MTLHNNIGFNAKGSEEIKIEIAKIASFNFPTVV